MWIAMGIPCQAFSILLIKKKGMIILIDIEIPKDLYDGKILVVSIV